MSLLPPTDGVSLIESAVKIMATADTFILVGTSLQVYPAAGLIEYLPEGIPKYIIDNNPPHIPSHYNFIVIKKPASEGMEEVKNLLISV